MQDVKIDERRSTIPQQDPLNECGDEVQKVKARNAKIEQSLRDLERMAQAFQDRVEGIVNEFEGLREDVEMLNLQYQGLEADYHNAMTSVEEEKRTVTHYTGLLRNEELKVELLERVVPEEHHPTAYSQAKW